MALDFQSADDEVYGIVNAILTGAVAAILGYAPDIRWQGVVNPVKPDSSKAFFRVSSQMVSDRLAAMGAAGGTKRYEAISLLYVQIFMPRTVGGYAGVGKQIGDLIASQFKKASPSGMLQFINPKIVTLPETESSLPINVVVEYHYDSLTPSLNSDGRAVEADGMAVLFGGHL